MGMRGTPNTSTPQINTSEVEMSYFKSEESKQRYIEGQKRASKAGSEKFRKIREEYLKNPKLCKQCGEVIPYLKRLKYSFCNSSCSAIYNNPNRRKNKYCINCGNNLKKNAKRYCSRDCEVSLRYKTYIEKWLQDPSFENKERLPKQIRRWLIEQKGEQCWECGWAKINPTTGNIPLQAHHLDGHSKNNRPENLKLLCPNCHSLTETYGSLNNGNGRELRYKKQESE